MKFNKNKTMCTNEDTNFVNKAVAVEVKSYNAVVYKSMAFTDL